MAEDRDVEVTHEVTSFAAELRRLADALDSGSAFTIHVDGEDVTIPAGARLSVAHEREDGEVELEFQVTWSAEDDEEDDDEDEDDGDEDDGDEDDADEDAETDEEADADEKKTPVSA